MANDPDTKRLLWFVFAGSRGGITRLKIISKLKENPLGNHHLVIPGDQRQILKYFLDFLKIAII